MNFWRSPICQTPLRCHRDIQSNSLRCAIRFSSLLHTLSSVCVCAYAYVWEYFTYIICNFIFFYYLKLCFYTYNLNYSKYIRQFEIFLLTHVHQWTSFIEKYFSQFRFCLCEKKTLITYIITIMSDSQPTSKIKIYIKLLVTYDILTDIRMWI